MKRWCKICVVVVLLGIALYAYSSGLTAYISLDWLQEHRAYLQAQVCERYWCVVSIYLAAYIAASCCALPGSSLFVIAGGLLFGFVYGMLFALLGLVAGATGMFLISRFVLGSIAQKRYGERFAVYNQAVKTQGKYYMLYARLFAIFPFGLLNIFAGVTLLPIKTFVLTTALGMAPHIALYVFVGQQLGVSSDCGSAFSPSAVVFFSTLLLRAGSISFLVRFFLQKRV